LNAKLWIILDYQIQLIHLRKVTISMVFDVTTNSSTLNNNRIEPRQLLLF
jgi:hypothetical protein